MNREGYSDLYAVKGDRIICQLCRHYCHLSEGQAGICGVNANSSGRLRNLVYGKIAALNIDPVEKKPLYHFLPGSSSLSIGTVGCNMKCPFCQNWQISQVSIPDGSSEATPEQLIAMALEYGCESISYTYNEPTIFYPFARDVAQLAHENGIKNIFVSNGMETPEMIDDMQGIIDGFNIDLKSFKTDYYKKYLKGSLEGVLDTLKRLKEGGFWLEVTTLIVPDDNDSNEELDRIAGFIAEELDRFTPWHISAFHPDYKVRGKPGTTAGILQKAYRIGRDHGLAYVYEGNTMNDGITYCPRCQKRLIHRVGYRVAENRVVGGKCPECERRIEGIWR